MAWSVFFTVTLFGGLGQRRDDMSQREQAFVDLHGLLELSVISIGLARRVNFFLPLTASQVDQPELAGSAHSRLLFRQVLLQHRERKDAVRATRSLIHVV